MEHFITLNALGFFSLVILIIVYYQATNYLDNQNLKLKRIWLSSIKYTFAVQLLDLLSRLLISIPNPLLRPVSIVVNYFLFVFVTVMSCQIALFINYSIEFSSRVYEKNKRLFMGLVLVNALITLFSIPFGYYFFIDGQNRYTNGSFYPLSLFISYLPLFIVLIRAAYQSKNRSLKALMITGILFPTYFLFLQITEISPVPIIFPSITTFILIMNSLLSVNAMYIDYLTGLKNARGVDKYFLSLPNKTDKYLMVLFIDFNDFKQINDMYGHKEGDYALCAFSKIIAKSFKNDDLVARNGGDEFLIVTQLDSEEDSEDIIKKIKCGLDKFNISTPKPFKLSVSYGCSINPPNVRIDKEALLDDADRKMYQQKFKNNHTSLSNNA